MPSRDYWNFLRTILAWVVAVVFIYAAVLKIADPADFAQSIKHYKLLPLWGINAVALLLPWWELGAAFALFVPSWRRAGALIVFLMTFVFTIAVSSAMIRGLDITCGCFGSYSSKVGVKLLSFDSTLLLATGFLFWSRGKKEAIRTLTGQPDPAGEEG